MYVCIVVCMYHCMYVCIYTVDSVLSGHLSYVDKSSGPGRTCLYFNIILSVLSGPLSYVDNGHYFSKFGQVSLSLVNRTFGGKLVKHIIRLFHYNIYISISVTGCLQ